jgi:polysaccharide deacetylase 2 family uncharacterized protein YibQ
VPVRDVGDVEFAHPRRAVTPARIIAGVLLLALIGGFGLIGSGLLPGEAPSIPLRSVEAFAPIPPPGRVAAVPTSPTQEPERSPTAQPLPASPRDRSTVQPLLPAPDPSLVETGPHGPLPIIGRDGRQPWRVYGRPFDRTDKRPRIAIIVTGLGPSGAVTDAAINELPGAVTLSFDPYTRRLNEWIDRARGAGHEILLAVPMEPEDYPRQDPGPFTLLTSLSAGDNLERLDWALSRVTGYVGLTNMMGSRFTTSERDLAPVFEELKKRGLMFVDGRASEQSVAGALAKSMNLPRAIADASLDAETTADAIDRRLAGLEVLAQHNGAALGIGFAYPVTVERVAAWAKTLEAKALVLAPASALAASPTEQQGAAK